MRRDKVTNPLPYARTGMCRAGARTTVGQPSAQGRQVRAHPAGWYRRVSIDAVLGLPAEFSVKLSSSCSINKWHKCYSVIVQSSVANNLWTTCIHTLKHGGRRLAAAPSVPNRRSRAQQASCCPVVLRALRGWCESYTPPYAFMALVIVSRPAALCGSGVPRVRTR